MKAGKARETPREPAGRTKVPLEGTASFRCVINLTDTNPKLAPAGDADHQVTYFDSVGGRLPGFGERAAEYRLTTRIAT